MKNRSSIVVISNISCEYRDVLIQRLVYRINRIIKPKLLLIVEDENNIPDSCYEILNDLKCPLIVVKDIKNTPFLAITTAIPDFRTAPFSYLVVENNIEIKTCQLAMDQNLSLVDNHIHTQLAYCSENMDVIKAIELGKLFGLKGMTFTEHSGQLYFNKNTYNKFECFMENISLANESEYRIIDYLNFKNSLEDNFVGFSLELDFDFNGEPIIDINDLKYFDVILGTMHQLPKITSEEFMLQLEKILKYGIDVLAHPFRIFKRNGKELPKDIIKPTVSLLKKYNTAAELNFHTNEPPIEFIRECLYQGVKLSFGSDSHNLAEIGDFSYQINILKEIGFKGDLKDILWNRNEKYITKV